MGVIQKSRYPSFQLQPLNSLTQALRTSRHDPWPTDGLRRASVNSFGIGGTNPHAFLEDAYNFLRLRNLTANHCTVSKLPKSFHVHTLPNHTNGALPKDTEVEGDLNSVCSPKTGRAPGAMMAVILSDL